MDWYSRLPDYFNTYFYEDWSFVVYLLIPIFFDTILGFYAAKTNHYFKVSHIWKLIDKLMLYFSVLLFIYVLTTFTISDKETLIFTWVKYVFCFSLISKEGISMLKNLKRIRSAIIPKMLIRKQLKKKQLKHDKK